MKRVLGMLVLVIALTGIRSAQGGAITYYVQLIRGTDQDTPPPGTCHKIGPRLAATFRPVLKWKSYWEICCKSVAVDFGQARRIELDNGREVEIDLTVPHKRKVTAYQNGKMMDRTTAPVEDMMTITGGDRDAQSVWFIVVRRDKPHPARSGI